MSGNINISVIVTVYNIEKYIGECLDSILSQEGVSFEVICVNDASTDGSYNILLEYERKDSRVKIINSRKNEGLSSSRNKGIYIAKGEYLYNIDGDDVLVPGALSTMHAYMMENKLDLLGFSAESFCNDKILAKEYEYSNDEYKRKKMCGNVMTGKELFTFLYEENQPATSNMCLYCIKTSFFKSNDLYDIDGLRYVDDSMFLKYMRAQRAMCVKDVLYKRRYRTGSAVMSPMKKIYLECMVVLFTEEYSFWHKMKCTEHENDVISQYFLQRIKEIDDMSYLFLNDHSEMKYLDKHRDAKFLYKYVIRNKMLYADNMSQQELQKVLHAEQLVVYGAGYYAEKFTDILENYHKYNYNVVTTCQTSKAYLKGHEVYDVSENKNLLENALVVVAVSGKYKSEIQDVLNTLNTKEIIWFCKS